MSPVLYGSEEPLPFEGVAAGATTAALAAERWPRGALARQLVPARSMAEEMERQQARQHPFGECTCAWWYWYDAAAESWYVARLCGGMRVKVTTRWPLHDPAQAEATAAAKSYRLNRIYSIPDPRDADP